VVATGGGAVIDPGNAEALHRLGPVVWLRARPATIRARVGQGKARPMLAGARGGDVALGRRIEALLASREAAYAGADLVVDTDGIGPEETARAVLAALEDKRRRGEA
jgi:shikimate kinase